MKHCLPDPKAAEMFGDYFTVFSCEYDSGDRSTGKEESLRIGEDGKIVLLLCHSCLDQLRGQILYPMILHAIKSDPKLFQELVSGAIKAQKGNENENG